MCIEYARLNQLIKNRIEIHTKLQYIVLQRLGSCNTNVT